MKKKTLVTGMIVGTALLALGACTPSSESQPAQQAATPSAASASPTPSAAPSPTPSPTPTVALTSGPACSYSMPEIVSELNASELVAVGELTDTNIVVLGRYGCWLLLQLPQPNDPADVIMHITPKLPVIVSGPALPLGTAQELSAVGVPPQFLEIAQSLGVLGENPAGSPINRFL